MTTRTTESPNHCAYCGHTLGDAATSERFGERFCSEAHAEEFVAGVRTARVEAAARSETAGDPSSVSHARGCGVRSGEQRTWGDYVKRGACWGAPLLFILAVPLIWSGGWAATGGSLLSVLALLACPLGMYFMMRGMSTMQRHGGSTETKSVEDDRRA
jgi:hypothetical protein